MGIFTKKKKDNIHEAKTTTKPQVRSNEKRYLIAVACRAGMGSSTLLHIKVKSVIEENGYPIDTIHGNLDVLIGFTGDAFMSMADIAAEPDFQNKSYEVIGIQNIMNKEEIQGKLEVFLENMKTKQKISEG
jgi:PTS system ascorbate-specific IIB component